jgi:acetoin utilization protein AcuB
MHVRDWMTRDVRTARAGDTVRDALDAMGRYRFRHLPVLDGDTLVGVVTERDLGRVDEEVRHRVALSAVMSPRPITAEPLDALDAAASLMSENKIGCLPVLEDGRLVGILTESDLYRSFVGLTGAGRPSTRLLVRCEDSAESLARLFAELARLRARVVSVISPPADQGHREVLVRVAMLHALPLVKALEAAGFPVDTPADLDRGAAVERGRG